jgi:lipopolysaccharide biosynthesis glycosyltransferase
MDRLRTVLALTIAAGPKYRQLAARAADSVRRSTGLQVVTITRVPQDRHPSYHRLWLWELVPPEIDAVLWFDADTYFVRPWDVGPLLDQHGFCAARDLPSLELLDECEEHGLQISQYFNAGLFLTHRCDRGILEHARDLVTDTSYRSRYLEQTALNVAVQRSGVDLHMLPPQYNAICRPAAVPVDPVVLHRAGGGRARRNAVLFERLVAEAQVNIPIT